MTENQTLKERLILFIKEMGMSVYAFEKECGLSQGYVKNIGEKIPSDKLGKISKQFPVLSTSWLMFGEGPMFYNSNDMMADELKRKTRKELELSEPTAEYGKAKDCLSCPWREQIAEKDRQIERLQGIIDTLIAKE